MNSLFRNVKTIHIPTIKYLSSKVTPSLSTIEYSSPITISNDTQPHYPRSRSLPPNLNPFKTALDHFCPIDFHPKAITLDDSNFRRDKSNQCLSRPTLKVICKFRRNFSQKSFGKSKNKPPEKQIDKKKKQGIRDRLYDLPCTKPENDSVRKKHKIFCEEKTPYRIKLSNSTRNLHVYNRSANTPQPISSYQKQYLQKSTTTFKDMYKQSPIKALIDLNEEVKQNKYKNDITTSQGKNKVKFHYLAENTECKQCVSKNKKRFMDFYKKNEDKMNKFFQKRRLFGTYSSGTRSNDYDAERRRDKFKEVVMVKDQNLNSGMQDRTVTLFNLIKLQSSRPKVNFVPTNSYKFEAKKSPDEYKFPPEKRERVKADPYPLEMFNEDYIADLESAKKIIPRKTESCPELTQKDLEDIEQIDDDLLSHVNLENFDNLRDTSPSSKSRQKQYPVQQNYDETKSQSRDSDPKKKPRRNAFLVGNNVYYFQSELEKQLGLEETSNVPYRYVKGVEENDIASIFTQSGTRIGRTKKYPYSQSCKELGALITMEDNTPDTFNDNNPTMQFAEKKCPDCGTNKKRAPCKIPVPKSKEEDDPCSKQKQKRHPCEKDNPCKHASSLSAKFAFDNPVLDFEQVRKVKDHDPKTVNDNDFTVQFAKKKCPDCGTNKKRAPCKIQVPKSKEEDDPCSKEKKQRQPCEKDNPCKHASSLLAKIEITEPKSTGDNSHSPTTCRVVDVNSKSANQLSLQVQESTTKELPAFQPSMSYTKQSDNNNDQSVPHEAAVNPFPTKRVSWQNIKKNYFGDCQVNTNHKQVDRNKFMEIFKARRKRYQELMHLSRQKANRDRQGFCFIHPKDSLNQKICDAIEAVPKVELGEQSKQMIATAIKKMIQPIIEKEFLKYEEVKVALERMEKHLAVTLNSLKPLQSTTAIEARNRNRLAIKYPWQKINEAGITDKNEHPEMVDPREKIYNHRDPLRRTSLITPSHKPKESYKDPYNENTDTFAKKYNPDGSSLKFKMEASSKNSDQDSCQNADNIFKKGKKTDAFALLSKKEDSCKQEKKDPCKKDDPCKKEDPCKKDDPCKKQDLCKKEDPCKPKDPCKKEDPCKPKDPCKKEDPCKPKDPCKKEDPCQKPDPCKKEPPKKSCDPCVKPETLCKIDPCDDFCGKQEEPPCCPPDPAVCESPGDEPQGGVITCQKSSVQECRQPCKPKVTCSNNLDQFPRKEIECHKCPSRPKIKACPPEPRNQPECCPKKPDCDAKCPDVDQVQCLQRPCRASDCSDEQESNACRTKKAVSCTECCVDKGPQHGLPGMKEVIKCDLTQNSPCPSKEKPRETFITVTKVFQSIQPAVSPSQNKEREPEDEQESCRYCDTNILQKEEAEKLRLAQLEAAKKKEQEAVCKKPVLFKSETRNKWMPVKIEPKNMGDKKILQQPKKTATKPKLKTESLEEPNSCKSDNKPAGSKKAKTKEKTLVESCSDKISDLCMMIVRKHKGGKKAAPIVVTLSRSQSAVGKFGDLSGITVSSSGNANEGGSAGRGGPKPELVACAARLEETSAHEEKSDLFGWTLRNDSPHEQESFLDVKDYKSKRTSSKPPNKQSSEPCLSQTNKKNIKSLVLCGKKTVSGNKNELYNCVKKSASKKDPCKQKEDPCKKKEDPCKKKEDPCKKKEDPCKKKEDPCKKKEDPCKKKEDPCKKKEDPCKKKDDPCKKKEDPCKKKEDPCKKKEDPCKKKEDPCKKKEDPCKKKEDPCKKKEDPCKKKEDPCKKKEDPCKKTEKSTLDPKIKELGECIKRLRSKDQLQDSPKTKKQACSNDKQDKCKKKEDSCKEKKIDPCQKKSAEGMSEKGKKVCHSIAAKANKNSCGKLLKQDESKGDACKKKEDPCKKKEDPCKKKEDPCKKKEDPCKKKEDPCKKKEDPCKKKEDPCKKKEDPCKKKEDPCKKKEDPCKKKEDPCKKKEDPCKKKEDPCKKKEDPCKKKEDPCKKKEDPCKKKEDPCKKKEDPCKKKEDPCKKKEDPCKKEGKPPVSKQKSESCMPEKKKENICAKKEKQPITQKSEPCIPCKYEDYSKRNKASQDPCKKAKDDSRPKMEDPCKKKASDKFVDCKAILCDKAPNGKACDNAMNKPIGLGKKKSFRDNYPWNLLKKTQDCLVMQSSERNCTTQNVESDPCVTTQKSQSVALKPKDDHCMELNKLLRKFDDQIKEGNETMSESLCKKENSCKMKNEDPCKKKEDPWKKKEDPCKKKEDPCMKKADPCKKKEDPNKKQCRHIHMSASSQGIPSEATKLPKDVPVRAPGKHRSTSCYLLKKTLSAFNICNPTFTKTSFQMSMTFHTTADVWKSKPDHVIRADKSKNDIKASKSDRSLNTTRSHGIFRPSKNKSALDLFPNKCKVDSSIGIVKFCRQKIREQKEKENDLHAKKSVKTQSSKCPDNTVLTSLKYSGPCRPKGGEEPVEHEEGKDMSCKDSDKNPLGECAGKRSFSENDEESLRTNNSTHVAKWCDGNSKLPDNRASPLVECLKICANTSSAAARKYGGKENQCRSCIAKTKRALLKSIEASLNKQSTPCAQEKTTDEGAEKQFENDFKKAGEETSSLQYYGDNTCKGDSRSNPLIECFKTCIGKYPVNHSINPCASMEDSKLNNTGKSVLNNKCSSEKKYHTKKASEQKPKGVSKKPYCGKLLKAKNYRSKIKENNKCAQNGDLKTEKNECDESIGSIQKQCMNTCSKSTGTQKQDEKSANISQYLKNKCTEKRPNKSSDNNCPANDQCKSTPKRDEKYERLRQCLKQQRDMLLKSQATENMVCKKRGQNACEESGSMKNDVEDTQDKCSKASESDSSVPQQRMKLCKNQESTRPAEDQCKDDEKTSEISTEEYLQLKCENEQTIKNQCKDNKVSKKLPSEESGSPKKDLENAKDKCGNSSESESSVPQQCMKLCKKRTSTIAAGDQCPKDKKTSEISAEEYLQLKCENEQTVKNECKEDTGTKNQCDDNQKKNKLLKRKPCVQDQTENKSSQEYLQLKCKPDDTDHSKHEADKCKEKDPCEKNKESVCQKLQAVKAENSDSCSPPKEKDPCEPIKQHPTIVNADESKEMNSSQVITKDCAPLQQDEESDNNIQDYCEEIKQIEPKDQSIQKGLKKLTKLLPGSVKTEVKDMGLLRQCFIMVKDIQHPVTHPITEEEIEKSMCQGRKVMCKVQKLGLYEKLVYHETAADGKSGECQEEPDFDEEGVERILQCVIVKDRNNCEKFVCTEVISNEEQKIRDEEQVKKAINGKCMKKTAAKIKVISNKLICKISPASDGSKKKDIVCSLATVEEIKTPGKNTCFKNKKKRYKKKAKAAMPFLAQKCGDKNIKETKGKCEEVCKIAECPEEEKKEPKRECQQDYKNDECMENQKEELKEECHEDRKIDECTEQTKEEQKEECQEDRKTDESIKQKKEEPQDKC